MFLCLANLPELGSSAYGEDINTFSIVLFPSNIDSRLEIVQTTVHIDLYISRNILFVIDSRYLKTLKKNIQINLLVSAQRQTSSISITIYT